MVIDHSKSPTGSGGSAKTDRTPTVIISRDDSGDRVKISFSEYEGSPAPIYFPANACEFGSIISVELRETYEHIHHSAHSSAMLYLESENPVYALQSAVHSMRYAIPLCRPVAEWLGYGMEDYSAIQRGVLPPPRRGAATLDRLLGFVKDGGPGKAWSKKDRYQADRLLAYTIIMRCVAMNLSEFNCSEEFEQETGQKGTTVRAILQKFRKQIPGWRKDLNRIKPALAQMFISKSNESLKTAIINAHGRDHWDKVEASGKRLLASIESGRAQSQRNLGELKKRRVKKRP